MNETILVTGGAGFIGSHACVALIGAGYEVVVFDNLSNSSPVVLGRVRRITGVAPRFIHGDIRDRSALDRAFADHAVSAVMHFAGLKAVGESVEEPLAYYDNNVLGTLQLLSAMADAGLRALVFSSSATIYGEPAVVPVREDAPRSATSPYGGTKLVVEDMLADLHRSDPRWSIARLRYFNPVGAHESGLIGEDPKGVPNNLMPCVAQVAIGRREKLHVYGGDYPTEDGTGVRDYIHVMDLAEGHVAALRRCLQSPGMLTVNLGAGVGVSVLQLVRAFEAASSRPVPYQIMPRRPGDVARCWADAALAFAELGWSSARDLPAMCEDTWRWQKNNPHGYQ